VSSRRQPAELLESVGYDVVEAADVTSAYRITQEQWLTEWERHGDALRVQLGSNLFDERQEERRTTLRAIDTGLLRRSFLLAVRR
jgi:signal transduction histidine kinase